jgi:F-box protein 7
MEARGGGAAVETHRVDLPPTATLGDVKTLLAAKLSASQPVPAESVRFSLNRNEELVSPDPAATLPDLGLASGDLVFFTLSPLTALAQPARALPPNPSLGSGAVPTAMAVDGGKGSEKTSAGGSSLQAPRNPSLGSGSVPTAMAVDCGKRSEKTSAGGSSLQGRAVVVNPSVPAASGPADVVMAEAVDATKGWSSLVLRDLKREMGNVVGAEGTAGGRLVAALHAALLEFGFLNTNLMGSRLSLPQDWPSVASKPLAIKYTIPELSPMLPVSEEGKVAVLNFSLMPNFVMVYGYVPGAQSEVCRLCLELPRLEPLLYLDSDQLTLAQERGVLDLWRVLKDEMCLPLMISLCQLNGLRLPPCLMALPADLKTKVLDVLPGDDLARVQCTCKEMKNLAADDDLWKKIIVKYNNYGEDPRGSMSAKAMFAEIYQANKKRQKRPHPAFWNYGWGNNPYSRPHRLPLIGGDSDRLPFIGNHGSVGRTFGNQRRNIVPNCILDGHRHNFL